VASLSQSEVQDATHYLEEIFSVVFFRWVTLTELLFLWALDLNVKVLSLALESVANNASFSFMLMSALRSTHKMKIDENVLQINVFSRISIWSLKHLFIFLYRSSKLLIKTPELLRIILLILHCRISRNSIRLINSTLIVSSPLVRFIKHLNCV